MLQRLITLITKELLLLLRERQTRFILIMPVLLQVLLFPFAATLEVKHTPLAVYNEDQGAASIELTQRFTHASAFSRVILIHNQQQLRHAIDQREALLVVHFPQDFSRQLAQRKSAALQLILDGRNSNSAQIAANYVQSIVQNYQLSMSDPQSAQNQHLLLVRNWFNPNLDYPWFVVPSLIAMITTIGLLIVTSLSVAREREQGTLDQLLVSPLTTWQIFAGKAVPALIVATAQASVVLLVGIFGYRIPFAGSLALYYLTMEIYGLSLVGVGLLISAISATQQQAFIGVFVFLMPAILLSGFMSPVENMPVWLQWLTRFNPVRYFMDITKAIYLKNADFSLIWASIWPLLGITLVTGGIAYAIFRRKIA